MREPSIKKNFIVYMLRNAAMMLTPLVIFPYASRVLGTEGIGKVQFAQNTAGYFELLAVFGLKSYSIREGAKVRRNPEKLGKLMTELLMVNLIMDVISVIGYFLLTAFIPDFCQDRFLVFIFAFEVVFNGLNFEWFYNVIEDYTFISIRAVIFQSLSVLFTVLFVRNSADIYYYAIALVLPFCGDSIANLLFSRKRVKLFGYGDYHLKKHFWGSFLIFAVILSTSLYMMLDTTMIGIMMNDHATGLYTAASKLRKLSVNMITAVCAVFLPRLALYCAEKDYNRYEELAETVSNIILMIAVPLSVAFFVFSKEFIMIFSGKDFIDASDTMKILSFDLVIAALNGFLAWHVLVPNNKEKKLFAATMSGGIADFVLNLLWIPVSGTAGAAIATVASEGIVLIICSLSCKKIIKLGNVWKYIWHYLIASIPIIPLSYLIKNRLNSSFLIVIATAALAIPLYCIILFVFRNKYISLLIHEIKPARE